LDKLKESYPDLYHKTKYTIIEISPELLQIQQDACKDHHNFQNLNMSILDWNTPIEQESFVIGMEVMDNLPHDKLVFTNRNTYQMMVENDQREVPCPMTDPTMRRCVDTIGIDNVFPRSNWFDRFIGCLRDVIQSLLNIEGEMEIFIPTDQFLMLEALKHFKNHHVILGDFDYLPVKRPNKFIVNEPITQKKVLKNGEWVTVEQASYLSSKGDCDMFFATNFTQLTKLYTEIHKNNDVKAEFVKHDIFMNAWADLEKFDTKSGYNPLVEDYSNFSYFVGRSKPK
jgi:hypothetical protein